MQDLFVNPDEARKYVLSFWKFMPDGKRPTYIETSSGRRINFYDMTDDEAIQCATMLKRDIEIPGFTK